MRLQRGPHPVKGPRPPKGPHVAERKGPFLPLKSYAKGLRLLSQRPRMHNQRTPETLKYRQTKQTVYTEQTSVNEPITWQKEGLPSRYRGLQTTPKYLLFRLRRIQDAGESSQRDAPYHGSRQQGDGGDVSQPNPMFLLFTVMPMGVAWKESTPEGLRPPQYSDGGGAPAHKDC